jgi:hypothetical protein
MQSTYRQQIGKRMKDSAKARGLTSERIGRALGDLRGGTVRGWWGGKSLPCPETMASYAALVGKPLSYLLGSDHNHDEETLERVRRMVYLMRGGLRVDQAAFLVFGKEGRISTDDLTLIRSAIPAMLAGLDLQAGGDWDLASVDRQLQILDRAEGPTSQDET